MLDMIPLLIAVFGFGCVTIVIFVIGRYATSLATMQRRLPVAASTSQSAGLSQRPPNVLLAPVLGKIDEKKFGIDGQLRAKLRLDLTRAGYFSDSAIRYYIF